MKAIARLKEDARKYELKEEWDRAIDAYLQVLRIAEEGDGSDLDLPLYNRVGDLFVRLGRQMDAVTYYEQAADRYAEAGLYNNAIALCNKALRYDAGRLALLKKLGAFSASQGFFTDARRWYLEYADRSIKRGALDDAFTALSDLAQVSDDAEIRELLAHHLREHGRTANAVEEYKRAHALRIAAGQQAEAAAIAAELQQLAPDVELSMEHVPRPPHQLQDWERDELPGFTDFDDEAESDVPESIAEPEAIADSYAAAADDTDEDQDADAGHDIEEAFIFEGSFDEPNAAEALESGAEADSLEDSAAEMFDLQHVSFESFTDLDAEAAETDEAADTADDLAPIDVEVEEEHELFNIASFGMERPHVKAPTEGPAESIDSELETLDVELPLLDVRSVEEIIAEFETGEVAEDDALPFHSAEPGSIASFDEAEFGDYGNEPPHRVFDFDEAAEEQGELADDIVDALDEALHYGGDADVDVARMEAEPLLDLPAELEPDAYEVDAGRSEEEPPPLELEEPSFEAAEPSFDIEEPSFEIEEPAFEVEEPTFEIEEPSFEVEARSFEMETPSFEVETPLFEIETPSFEMEASSFELETPSWEWSAPAFEVESEAVDEPREIESPTEHEAEAAQPAEEAVAPIAEQAVYPEASSETDNIGEARFVEEAAIEFDADDDALVAQGSLVEEPVSPPLTAAPNPRKVAEYVDLAALFGEEDEEKAEESTRFVVAEMPPTGDEEKDFADMLQQFKQKVAQNIPKEDAGSHYDLGIAFKEMGLIDEAIGEFQTALRSGQEKLKVYEELGSCFMLKQQYSIAITVLNRAQHMPCGDETELLGVYYNLGRAHEELGQRNEAKAAFEKILAVDIGFQDTTQRLARL